MSRLCTSTPIPESMKHPPVYCLPKKLETGYRRSQFAINASSSQIEFPDHEPLGFLQTARLIRRAQSEDPQATQQLWTNNARLCYSVANSIVIRGDLVADLIQESQEAFPKAIRNFDIDRLYEFSTYAYAAIRSHMIRALPKIRFSTKIPTNLYKPLNRYIKKVANASDRSHWFDAREDMINLGTYANTRDLHAIANPIPIEHAQTSTASKPSADQQIAEQEYMSQFHNCMKQLGARDQFILIHRYGIGHHPEMTLQAIGDQLQLTRERVRQLQLLAEQKLKELLEESDSPNPTQSTKENPIMATSMIEVSNP